MDCPKCGAGLQAIRRRKPSIARKKKRRKRKELKDDWRESLLGAFVYAFPAVLRGKGWLCWLWCAAVMAVLPIIPAMIGLPLMCIPFIGEFLYFAMMFILVGAAPAGILSRNMEISSRFGAREEMEHSEMSLRDEMIPSAIELLKANLVLSLFPLLIAGAFAIVLGGFASISGGSLESVGQIGSLLTWLLYLGVALACSFCGPMCIMLLGAGAVENAVYPPNVFKVMSRTFPQYLAFYFYIVTLAVATYVVAAAFSAIILLVFGSFASVWDSSESLNITLFVLANVGAWFVVCVVATYFSAVVGWSMGIFVHRNYEHFEAVIE